MASECDKNQFQLEEINNKRIKTNQVISDSDECSDGSKTE